jgi:UDP-2,3-diacylglucosamine hydrolase
LNSWQGSKLIHGHTHRPGSHPLAGGHERVVLSDWDLDHTPARAQVLRWQAGQWRRHPITP